MKNKSTLLTLFVLLTSVNFTLAQSVVFNPTNNNYQRNVVNFEILKLKGNIKSFVEIKKEISLKYANEYGVKLVDRFYKSYEFNEANELVFYQNEQSSIIYKNKLPITVTYFAADSNHRVITYQYNDKGLLLKTITNKNGQIIGEKEFLWDDKDRLVKVNKLVGTNGLSYDIKYLPDGSFYATDYYGLNTLRTIRLYKFNTFPAIYPSMGAFPSKNILTKFDETSWSKDIDYSELPIKEILMEEWDKDGKIISEFSKYPLSKKDYFVFHTYDQQDRRILRECQENGEDIIDTYEYKGDKINGINYVHRRNGSLIDDELTTYNEHGDPITATSISARYEYKYDHHNNWIERKAIFVDKGLTKGSVAGDKLDSITTRKIIYQ